MKSVLEALGVTLLAVIPSAAASGKFVSSAEPPASAQKQAPDKQVSEQQIEEWVRQLGDKSGEKRDEAVRHLKATGKQALEKLAAAGESKTTEVARRSLAVLKYFLAEGDQKTKSAAEAVLKKLSASKIKETARLAAEALEASKKFTAAQLDAWVEMLRHEKADKRDEAVRNLKAAGKQAIEKVTEAGESKTGEVAQRCVDVLKHLFTEGDEDTKALAEKSLKKLSASQNKNAAQLAADALQGGSPSNPMVDAIVKQIEEQLGMPLSPEQRKQVEKQIEEQLKNPGRQPEGDS